MGAYVIESNSEFSHHLNVKAAEKNCHEHRKIERVYHEQALLTASYNKCKKISLCRGCTIKIRQQFWSAAKEKLRIVKLSPKIIIQKYMKTRVALFNSGSVGIVEMFIR
ncbi:hypothetical protein CEXT_394441 [Caerostris extrusa]|uniref:Uncharacterized protein n=1 Tax=Caerostris extrusa TaxID=172846 RepID=A0AAV4TCC0_CAEEX|nr:hypothetical protein CEXT_394441 [Caerostris extrusa]